MGIAIRIIAFAVELKSGGTGIALILKGVEDDLKINIPLDLWVVHGEA